MIEIDKKSINKKESITVGFFYENIKSNFSIKLFSDDSGFNRLITNQNLHRPGLALAGFVELFSYNRVQIFGNTEMKYLNQLNARERENTLRRLFDFDIPCIILTDGNEPFPELLTLSNSAKVPIFGSALSTTKLVYFVGDFLDDQFALRCSMHGAFVDVYGVGILFTGKSGIGKSEVALDLVERGHRLVSDDVIIVTKKGEGVLLGAATELNKHFLEIRGLGLINIRKMFGVRSVRYQKRLEVIVELEDWDNEADYERTGLGSTTVPVLDVEIPYIKLPIVPGKNITVISEVISLHYLLKHYGYDAAVDFQSRLNQKLMEGSSNVESIVKWFEGDKE